MPKRNICVVIPAFNEEQVIVSSLRALKKVIRRDNIYVVSDGSTDSTAKLARQQHVNVMALRKNVGKAVALNKLIKTRKLTERYKYVLFTDADSRLDENFSKEIKKALKHNAACLVGTVVSDRKGLVSAFRTYEYGLSHRVFKKAQSVMGVVTIAPGCTSLYRGDVLSKLYFSRRTLSEDFDLTVQIHKQKLGKILYVPSAKVITQDPVSLPDFWKQIMRWNTGFWQNIFCHKLYRPFSKLSLEIYLLVFDSLGWFASLAFAIFFPGTFLYLMLYTYLMLVSLSSIIIFIEKKLWALLYVPFFPILYLMNLAAYSYSFFRALLGKNRELSWSKVGRYQV